MGRIDNDRGLAAVLHAARDGQRQALGQLYDQFGTMVFNAALRLTQDEQDAADIVQDVFWALPRALRTFEGRGPFGVWLRRITTRRALMHLRHARLRRAPVGDLDAVSDGEGIDLPVKIDITRAMRQLDPPLRDVFILKVIEGYTHEEIAALLSISVSNSKIRLFRARKSLQAMLADDR